MTFLVRRGELVVGGSFLLAATALALVAGVDHFSLPIAALYVLGIAVAGNVRFDVGAGFTVPTQVIFLPMLFAVPVTAVPLLVALALALGMAPRIIRGGVSPSWLLTAAANSWFALGPALVLLIANDHSPDGRWDILLLALAAQFVCDFAAAAVRDRLFDDISLRELVDEVRPIYAIDLALSPLGLAVAVAASTGNVLWPVVIAPLFLVIRGFSSERRERLEQLAELNDAYQGTALLLGDVVEADDSYTGEHCKSVVRLALDVADELGLDADQKRNVEFGALLHDVGKIAVPKDIINKPGKLDEREWAIVKTHTIEGQKMLEKIGGFMREIGRIVRASHERWDGSGYPDGLSGEAIPLEARIISACDAFSAMTTTRSYRKAMPLADVIAEMSDCAGSHFDPHVVTGLLRVVEAPLVSRSGALRLPNEPSPAAPEPSTSSVRDTDQSSPARVSSAVEATSEMQVVRALAELAVCVGANIQPGQEVEVSGEVGHLVTVRAIVEAAYGRGARFVDVCITDPVVQRARISAAPEEALAHVPPWEGDRVRELAERSGASILVTGPTFPGLFDDLDPRSVSKAYRGPSAAWRDAARVINWTIVPAATVGWAKQLHPQLSEEDALAALWGDLAHVCRLDEADPISAWRERLAALRRRAEWLTALELDAVHLRGPETDLTIGLLPGARWERPEMTTPQGIVFLPNLPTEEVYTTPDPPRVDGHVRLTRPVDIGGRQIDGITLRFSEGRVVDISGPPEASALREFIARDAGASRLGELALVDGDSRVTRLGQTFGETILDENAACHIALGYGFAALLPETSPNAANMSDDHLDVMVGSAQVQINGVDRRGASHALLRDGHWAEPSRGRYQSRLGGSSSLLRARRHAGGTASTS